MHGFQNWFMIKLIKRKLRPQSVTDLKQNCVSFPPAKIVEIFMHSETENLTEKLDLKNKLLLIMGYTKYTTIKKNYFHQNFHQFKEEPNLSEWIFYLSGFCGEIDGLNSMNLLYWRMVLWFTSGNSFRAPLPVQASCPRWVSWKMSRIILCVTETRDKKS